MDRSFPPEAIRTCENCGHDMTVIALDDGGFEANDQRDYVWADPGSDPDDHMFVCSGCRAAVGVDDDYL